MSHNVDFEALFKGLDFPKDIPQIIHSLLRPKHEERSSIEDILKLPIMKEYSLKLIS